MARRKSKRRSTTLSPREYETVQLVCGGLSFKQAARVMGISDRTVEAHIYAACRKVGDGIGAPLLQVYRWFFTEGFYLYPRGNSE